MKNNTVQHTASGLITRYDVGVGLLVYSPYSGLIFAIHDDDVKMVFDWIDKRRSNIESIEYKKFLGFGWSVARNEVEYPIPHLLPHPNKFPIMLRPKYPIVINWLITGVCPLMCKYCFAEDLMRNTALEPSANDVNRIVKAILSYKPLAVVLTGGDPLSSPHLLNAIKLLYERVGVILDTSAYAFSTKHLSILKKYKVAVRISFDSERPEINQKQRPSCSKNDKGYTLRAAIKALCMCIENGITVSVQSVATKNTANDLPALGDKLYRLGVPSWRIFKVQSSKKNIEGYNELVGSKRKQGRLYRHIFSELGNAHKNLWNKQMAVQVAENETPNAVILVSPDGVFYTESNIRPGKVVLDEHNRTRPRLSLLRNKVNMHAHAERYFNLTWPKYDD